MKAAQMDGAGVLLTGQGGNSCFSWTGFRNSHPIGQNNNHALSSSGKIRKGFKLFLLSRLPRPWALWLKKQSFLIDQSWADSTALSAQAARRLRVARRSLNDPLHPIYNYGADPLEVRGLILLPGRSFRGARWAECGASYGLDVRDPTLDARLLAYTWSIPDRFFSDPETGLNRIFARQAMQGRLPDEVRLNRKRGRQSADLVLRLRNDRQAMQECLDGLADSRAAELLDLERMNRVWKMVLEEDTPQAYHESVTILTRGLMAGIFLNDLEINRN
jgi:asparagine synthase (glutamine-hydrolysing)